MLRKILTHPATTVIAVLTGLVSALTQLGGQLQQVTWQMGPLVYQIPHSQKFFVGLTIASAACTFIAGIGNSLLTTFLNKKQNEPTSTH